MANWAAYKEKEIGLPVVKRAKHGIHFDAGKGLVQAEFVGKPCHYFDGKEYKAIDTRPLLRKDGTFGCAHSDVIIHTDGTVQVGDYTQRAALIYPGKVSVDGDRIARPFSGGVQYLYITENGFRQEIVLEKMPDLRKVSALVDTVKGILPTKYTASSLSLKDSSTAELSDFVQVDSKSLASVLEVAKYPVTIDPDFAASSSSGDTTVRAGAADNNYGGSATASAFNAATNIKHLFRFDCSSIDSGNTCTAAVLTFTKMNAVQSSAPFTVSWYSIASGNSGWVQGTKSGSAESGSACWNYKAYNTTNWAGSAGLSTADTDYENTVLGTMAINRADEQYSTWTSTFNASGIARVQNWFDSPNTNYGIVGWTTGATNNMVATSENATESYRPVLTVTYTAAGTFIPINMNAQMQNLSGNMRG